MSEKDYISLIRERLSDYRLEHSINVAKRAMELARLYGADEHKAYIAGILHDVTKEEDYSLQEQYIASLGISLTELEKRNRHIWHQMSGAGYARSVLGIEDEDILGGIRYHTTGRADMTDFEMIIYLADLTSAERCFADIEKTRAESEKSLLDGMLYALSFIIGDLASKGREIHPDTLYCYNWVVSELNKRK